jgi:hypothetical protein
MIGPGTEISVNIKEGSTYPFKIKGIVNIPDGSECFVLIDPNNVKHLLETRLYVHYQFEVGQTISCRIDKINCNGKIYIEPMHPYYRVGKKYKFPLTRIEENNRRDEKKVAVFEDVFCNEIKLPMHHFPVSLKIGHLVELFVTRIKRGQIFLSEPGFDEDYSGMTSGTEYSFVVKELVDLPGKRSYFVIVSIDGRKYKLRHKYYENYGFEMGQVIFCRFVKSGKEIYLEPRHPFYQINAHYDFEIIGEELAIEYPAKERNVYILNNLFGKNVLLPIDKTGSATIINGKINCRVRDIRKGKLLLNCRK